MTGSAATASRRAAATDMKKASIDITETLARLSMATIFELRGEWRRLHRAPPPIRLSRDLLMRAIAYKLQERLSRVSMRSCLVTRSSLGSPAFSGVFAAAARSVLDTTERRGFLAMTVADVALRRFGAEDLALPFLAEAPSRFWDFSTERVGMALGSFWFAAPKLTLARPKAPQIAGRALTSLAVTKTASRRP